MKIIFEGGAEKIVPFGSNLMGMTLNGKRPIDVQISVHELKQGYSETHGQYHMEEYILRISRACTMQASSPQPQSKEQPKTCSNCRYVATDLMDDPCYACLCTAAEQGVGSPKWEEKPACES